MFPVLIYFRLENLAVLFWYASAPFLIQNLRKAHRGCSGAAEVRNGSDVEAAGQFQRNAAQSVSVHTSSDLRSSSSNHAPFPLPLLLHRSAQPPRHVLARTHQGELLARLVLKKFDFND